MRVARLGDRILNSTLIAVLAWLLLRPGGALRDGVERFVEGRAMARALDTLWVPLAAGASPVNGDTQEVTIVQFTDYQCPACRAVESDVRALLVEHPSIRVGIRHLPLGRLRPMAGAAAEAAVCAELHDSFTVVHAALLHAELEGITDWRTWLVNQGIHAADGIADCIMDGLAAPRLAEDARLADELGVAGTPAFVGVNGYMLGLESAERLLRISR